MNAHKKRRHKLWFCWFMIDLQILKQMRIIFSAVQKQHEWNQQEWSLYLKFFSIWLTQLSCCHDQQVRSSSQSLIHALNFSHSVFIIDYFPEDYCLLTWMSIIKAIIQCQHFEVILCLRKLNDSLISIYASNLIYKKTHLLLFSTQLTSCSTKTINFQKKKYLLFIIFNHIDQSYNFLLSFLFTQWIEKNTIENFAFKD